MRKVGNKILALIIGVSAILVVFAAIVFIMTRADKPASQPSNGIITANDLKSVKEKTTGLKNFGDLPITVTKDEIGRSNPFESY
jgi:predicted permease